MKICGGINFISIKKKIILTKKPNKLTVRQQTRRSYRKNTKKYYKLTIVPKTY